MPKGGARKGAGRKARPTSKAKGIWLGQITNEQRDFIVQSLSPAERFNVLMEAANKACIGRLKLVRVYEESEVEEVSVGEYRLKKRRQ